MPSVLTLTAGLQEAFYDLTHKKYSIGIVVADDDMGIGAIVLVHDSLVTSGDSYGIFESISLSRDGNTKALCHDALASAGITPGDIGYLESTVPDLDDGTLTAYREAGYDLTCALEQFGWRLPNFQY